MADFDHNPVKTPSEGASSSSAQSKGGSALDDQKISKQIEKNFYKAAAATPAIGINTGKAAVGKASLGVLKIVNPLKLLKL